MPIRVRDGEGREFSIAGVSLEIEVHKRVGSDLEKLKRRQQRLLDTVRVDMEQLIADLQSGDYTSEELNIRRAFQPIHDPVAERFLVHEFDVGPGSGSRRQYRMLVTFHRATNDAPTICFLHFFKKQKQIQRGDIDTGIRRAREVYSRVYE